MRNSHDLHIGEFLQLFSQLDGKYDKWDIWSDFLTISACFISNQVDYEKERKMAREAEYIRVKGKYSSSEQELFRKMLLVVGEDICQNHKDFLGRAAEELKLVSKTSKQYYTPECVGRVMAMITIGEGDNGKATSSLIADKVTQKGYAGVLDCCCGAGDLLITLARELVSQEIDYPNHVEFVAQDISYTAALACYIQLSFFGCAGYVVVGDSLSKPAGTGDTLKYAWYTPMYFAPVWADRRKWHYIGRYIILHSSQGEAELEKQTKDE